MLSAKAIIVSVSTLAVFPAVLQGQHLDRPEIKCLAMSMYFPETGIRVSDTVAADFDYLQADMIRMEFIGVPPGERESIDYNSYDYIVNKLGDRDIGVLGLVDYASVPWTTSDDWGTDVFRSAFVTRLSEIVTHYHDAENPIKHWEIWNEPDLDVTGEGGPDFRVEPLPYAKILIDSYEAIKAIDPDAVVIFGGISPKGFEYSSNYYREVYQSQPMQDYYTAHGYYPFDAVGAHPYPEVFTRPNPGMANVLNLGVKAVMNEFGDTNKKVWITEMGWSSNSWRPTESQQASYLSQSFHMMDDLVDPANPTNGPYIEKYFWFQYEDFGAPDIDNWGLYTQGRTRKKPSYDAYLGLTPPGPTPTPTPVPTPEPTLRPGEATPVFNGTSDADLEIPVSSTDLLNGIAPVIIGGGFHEATVGDVSALTNGVFDANPLTCIVRDYPYPEAGLLVEWTFDEAMDLAEVRTFAGHAGDGGNRAYQNNSIYINGELAIQELTSGPYGQVSPSSGASAVSLVRWLPEPGEEVVAHHVKKLGVAFYGVSLIDGGIFADRWSPVFDESMDTDGYEGAYVSPIIKEVDAFGQPSAMILVQWVLY